MKAVHQKIRDFAQDLEVPILDLLPSFEGKEAAWLRIGDADSHPNPEAHRIAADAIVTFIATKK